MSAKRNRGTPEERALRRATAGFNRLLLECPGRLLEVDPEALNIASPIACVLGQCWLEDADKHNRGILNQKALVTGYWVGVNTLHWNLDQQISFGVLSRNKSKLEYYWLTVAWQNLLRTRRHEIEERVVMNRAIDKALETPPVTKVSERELVCA